MPISAANRPPVRHVCLLLCSLFLFVAAAGCAPPRGEVKGTVTYKNEPVKTGTVTIGNSQGKIEPDGSYLVKDVEYGENKVLVVSVNDDEMVAFAKKLSEAGKGAKFDKDGQVNMPKPPAKGFSYIPERYGNPATTDLKVTVGASITEYNITLSDKK